MAQHCCVENEHAPDAQKQPPGTTHLSPAAWLFDGHSVTHRPFTQLRYDVLEPSPHEQSSGAHSSALVHVGPFPVSTGLLELLPPELLPAEPLPSSPEPSPPLEVLSPERVGEVPELLELLEESSELHAASVKTDKRTTSEEKR